MNSATSGPSHSEDSATKKDSLPPGGKNKRELVRPTLLPRFFNWMFGLDLYINGDEVWISFAWQLLELNAAFVQPMLIIL